MLTLTDDNTTRCRLVKSVPGDVLYNWLFLPGGPGVDSSYFSDLVESLSMPGNYWLIDLPMNGDNRRLDQGESYDFDEWSRCFMSIVKQFDQPILVGHSFGGMFPLIHPELESLLKGYIILNSAPTVWMEEAARLADAHNIPHLEEPIAAFQENPNAETFQAALVACAPYYFMEKDLEAGKALLAQLPVNYLAATWWLTKAYEMPFNATWIPQTVPTLIVGGSHDFICPVSLFQRDERFSRPNIQSVVMQNSGHIPWFDSKPALLKHLSDFYHQCLAESVLA